MEKAFAKLNGSYSNIESGNFYEAMTDLTGEGSETFNFTEGSVAEAIRNGKFWQKVRIMSVFLPF